MKDVLIFDREKCVHGQITATRAPIGAANGIPCALSAGTASHQDQLHFLVWPESHLREAESTYFVRGGQRGTTTYASER
jgi:hypothetical protein